LVLPLRVVIIVLWITYILRFQGDYGLIFNVMKQYLIDELRPHDHEQIKNYLDANFARAELDGIYWIPLETRLLTPVQTEHTACQPFFLVLALEPTSLACELLVRTKQRMRCDCIGYATEVQRNWIIGRVDALLDELAIKT